MSGHFLNSYPLTLRGEVELFEVKEAARDFTRAQLRETLGASVWLGRSDAYCYVDPGPAAPRGQIVTRSLTPTDPISRWAMREALAFHCHDLGYEAWFGRAGELHLMGPIPPATEDRFRIEHGLVMRLSHEDFIEADAILTARPRTRWICTGTLAELEIASRAVGRRAIRLGGNGPRTGVVASVSEGRVTLRSGGFETEVDADKYTISANASLIAQWRGTAVLRRVRFTAGDLTANGKKNRHAVEDRFKLLGDSIRKLGPKFSTKGGGEIEIGARPVSIRMEGGR